jgi:hypothetical protein
MWNVISNEVKTHKTQKAALAEVRENGFCQSLDEIFI